MVTARTEVEFPSGTQHDLCRAWLYRPTERNAPLIVMAHGLGGTRDMRLDAFAERFVAAGYACLVFDYRYFGGSDGAPRHLTSFHAQLTDWAAALAYARSLDDVDVERLVAWGSSLGGGHAIVAARRDGHVSAVIAQAPFTDGLASTATIPPRTALRLTLAALSDLVASRRGRPRVYVPTAGRPGTVALMTAPDCLPGLEAITPSGDAETLVTASIALEFLTQFPGRHLRRLRCPTYVGICETDTVAPARATARHARRAPNVQIENYPFGHFDIYVGAAFEQAVTDQIAFLHANVPPRA